MSSAVPDGWHDARFDSFCTLQRGFDLPIQNRSDGKYPIFGSNGIVGYHNESSVKAPCVVTGRSGSIGQVFYFEEDFWALNTSLYVKNFHGNQPKYVYFFLEQFDLSRFGTGTGVPTLNRNDVHCVEIRYPPRPEQKKIASILTSLDEVIEKTESQIAKLHDLKTGMMQELLTKGIGHTDFKDSPVGRIPVGWDLHSMESICRKITDGEHLSPKCLPEGKPILSAKDIEEYGIDFLGAKFVSPDAFEKMLKRCNPELGDVLIISRGATIGKSTLNISNKRFALMGSVILLKPKEQFCIGEYLTYFIQLPQVQQSLLQLSGSSAQQAIYLKDIKQLTVPLPDIEEQKRISSSIASVDERIKRIQGKLGANMLAKKALMQDLLTGKVRVKTD